MCRIRYLVPRIEWRNLETLRYLALGITNPDLGLDSIDFGRGATDGEVGSRVFGFLTGTEAVIPAHAGKVAERASVAARGERGFGAGAVDPGLVREDAGVARVVGVSVRG